MIDTDEYEGYTYRRVDTDEYEGYTIYRRDKLGTYAGTDRYVWSYFACELPSWASEADFRLMEDAPKLLAEVKRLREQLDNVRYWVSGYEDEHMMSIFKMWIGEEE